MVGHPFEKTPMNGPGEHDEFEILETDLDPTGRLTARLEQDLLRAMHLYGGNKGSGYESEFIRLNDLIDKTGDVYVKVERKFGVVNASVLSQVGERFAEMGFDLADLVKIGCNIQYPLGGHSHPREGRLGGFWYPGESEKNVIALFSAGEENAMVWPQGPAKPGYQPGAYDVVLFNDDMYHESGDGRTRVIHAGMVMKVRRPLPPPPPSSLRLPTNSAARGFEQFGARTGRTPRNRGRNQRR